MVARQQGHWPGTKLWESLGEWELDGQGLKKGVFTQVPCTQDLGGGGGGGEGRGGGEEEGRRERGGGRGEGGRGGGEKVEGRGCIMLHTPFKNQDYFSPDLGRG